MDMENSTLITLAWELYEQGVPKSRIAVQLGKHRETIHLWIRGIQARGLMPFLDSYEQAKKGERQGRQVDPYTQEMGMGYQRAGMGMLWSEDSILP